MTVNSKAPAAGAHMRLLCSSVDFGFGAAGKLSAILQHLPDADLMFMQSRLGSSIGLRTDDRRVSEDADLGDVDAALVILDPELATRLTRRGIPVIYVDSLAHLWGTEDHICTDVAAYCAQQVAGMNVKGLLSLAEVRNLIEVEAIVPQQDPADRGDGFALVNVGGVHSPFSAETPSYCGLVLPSLVRMLQDQGYQVRVIGNVDTQTAASFPAGVEAGPVRHSEVGRLLAESSLLFTSPGLTTLLEAGAAGIPTVMLPPQNVSQVLNADKVTRGTQPHFARTDWPPEHLDTSKVRALAKRSEMRALRYMYDRLESLAGRGDIAQIVAEDCLGRLPASADWLTDYANSVGTGGAAQVAQIVRQVAAGGDG